MGAQEVAGRPPPLEVVGRFAAVWRDPSVERLTEMCHPDCRLVAPMMREARGREAARLLWRDLLDALPDLRGQVVSSSGEEDLVFIEVRLRATVARRPYEW